MSRGKYLSLEEARKSGKLDRFAKEHLSEGDRTMFFRLVDSIAEEAGTDHVPVYYDIAPFYKALEEAASLLGAKAGEYFIASFADRLDDTGPSLFRTKGVPAGPADDRAFIRIEPSSDFVLALAALRTGDRDGFCRHLQIPHLDVE